MGSYKVRVKLKEQALEQGHVELFFQHVSVDLLNDAFRFGCIKFLPTLEEYDIAVTLVEIAIEEGLHVLVLPCLHKLLVRLVSCDQIRDAGLCLIEKLGCGHLSFLSSSTCALSRNACVVDQIVIAHENLGI